MANTIFTYTGNGVANSWTVGCDYLSKEHIELFVDDVEDTAFTWITDSTIAAATVPANGAVITVQRVTPRSALVTSIPVSGTLRGNDVNRIGLQSLYVAEEGYDALTSVMQEDLADGKWDAQSKVIKDLAAPVNANDAARKTDVDTVVGSASAAAASASAASASALAAAASASSASGSASTATTQAGIATAQAVLADADRVAADASASAASGSASTAATQASNASSSASTASGFATTATTQAGIATTQASNASGSASTASTQASNASSSASAAAASALAASGSETAAAASALAASGSASSASSSASTATTQAGNASTSASNASTSASTATTQAGIATTQAGNAATSASDASTSASTATTQAGIATTQAGLAATAKTAAEAAQAATESIFDQFGDQYLGSKASDPTLDNDGDALTTGDIYWNSSNNTLRFYNGSAWVAPETIASAAATTATTQAGIATTQAGLAATAKTAAETAETNAETAETNAELAETNAAASAVAAAASSSSASGFATTASGHATTATTQAGIATTQAGLAATAKTAAELAETNAETAETNAAASSSSASGFATTASGHATTATTQAGIATTQAGNASTSASNASTSASTATTQAGIATTQAGLAATAKTAAEAAQTAAEAAYDSFDDRYLGSKTSDPTLDNDGNALLTGALYFNSTVGNLRYYTGSVWNAVATGTYTHPNHSGDVTSVADGAQTIAADAVTNAKLADMAANTLKGNNTGSPADPIDLTATQVRTLINVADGANAYTHPNHSGDVTSVADGATTIAADAVTNAKLANMAANSIKGNNTGGATDPLDLTVAQVKTLLAYTVGDIGAAASSHTHTASQISDASANGRSWITAADYAAMRTLLNVEDGATNDMTASEILTAIKTVDGAGSGLDADLLDGLSSASFTQFASGTRLTFQQTSAPTGWTKDTTHDNKAMRLVSGTVGSGGSVSFTSAFTSRGITGSTSGTVGNTTLTESQLAAHSHNRRRENGASSSVVGVFATAFSVSNTLQATDSAGGGSSHNHSWSGSISVNNLDMAVQYVDFIVASKD